MRIRLARVVVTALLGFTLVAGCGDEHAFLRVTVVGVPAGADRLRVIVTQNDQRSAPHDFDLRAKAFDRPTFVLVFDPDRAGSISVTVTALDRAGQALAERTERATVAAGRTMDLTVSLVAAPGDAGPDLQADEATPPPDAVVDAGPDLSLAADVKPDLSLAVDAGLDLSFDAATPPSDAVAPSCQGRDLCGGGSTCCDDTGKCVDLRVDVMNCGACGHLCPAGNLCCDSKCVVPQGDVKNCGACGIDCGASKLHLLNPGCNQGVCKGICEDEWDDCNGDPADGCETDIANSPDHCGACKYNCESLNANATWSCGMKKCVNTGCIAPHAHCTSNPKDICETDVTSSNDHCGKCSNKCTNNVVNGFPGCVKGKCGIGACKPGFDHCPMDQPDACQTDLRSDVNNCGACGTNCLLPPNVDAKNLFCALGRCQFHCSGKYQDCDLDPTTGCEADLTTDNDCGCCGGICPGGTHCGDMACTNGKSGGRVLILGTNAPRYNDIDTFLKTQGLFCGVDRSNSNTISLQSLKGYAAVVAAEPDNATWTNLYDYFNGGGRVVTFADGGFSGVSAGKWKANGYDLVNKTGNLGSNSFTLGTVQEAACPSGKFCPLLRDVTSFNGASKKETVVLANGGVLLVDLSDGNPLVVIGKKNGRGRIDLNTDPTSGDMSSMALLRNALLYR